MVRTFADTHFFGAIDDGATTSRDVVAALRRQHLTMQPGTAYRYANVNYVLAGRLVEVTTDRPFHEQLHDQFLAPLGLGDTRFDWDAGLSQERCKRLYRPDGQEESR